MKIITLAAAAAVALTGVAPAMAQHTVVTERTVVHRDGPVVRHRVAPRAHKVCRTTYRHHHRVRTCRLVRGR
jgi:hypothetical protein